MPGILTTSVMVGYAIEGDDEALYPDEPNKFAVVMMDELKPPDSEDFMTVISEFTDDEFELPTAKDTATYYVHTADGETLTRSEWEEY